MNICSGFAGCDVQEKGWANTWSERESGKSEVYADLVWANPTVHSISNPTAQILS